jgi:Lrp/AsnC family transcriptional regulator, leucine-responsive regulatory protein
MELDEIDLRILAELETDADRANVAVARAVGLSPAATHQRTRKLKEAGVIQRVTAQVDPAKAGFPLLVYVQVTLGRHDDVAHRRIEKTVREMPQVIQADWVAGEIDLLLTVVGRSIAELQRVLFLLSSRGGAQRVVSLLRLEEVKSRAPLPVGSEA